MRETQRFWVSERRRGEEGKDLNDGKREGGTVQISSSSIPYLSLFHFPTNVSCDMGSVLRREGGRTATVGAAADCRCHQMWLHCDSKKKKKKKKKQEQRGEGVGGAVRLFPNNIGINDDKERKEKQQRRKRPQNKTRLARH